MTTSEQKLREVLGKTLAECKINEIISELKSGYAAEPLYIDLASVVHGKVEFTSPEKKQKFDALFPKIMAYMQGRPANQWISVEHALVRRKFIFPVKFPVFMRWLNKYHKYALMGRENIKAQQRSWFAQHVNEFWTFSACGSSTEVIFNRFATTANHIIDILIGLDSD